MSKTTKTKKLYGKSPNSTRKPFSVQQTIRHQKYYHNFTIACGAFLLAFIAASLFTPVSNSSAEQQVIASVSDGTTGISVYGSGTINLAVDNPTASGQLVKASDPLTVDASQAPHGYQLYLSMDNNDTGGNRLYLGGSTSGAYLTPNQSSGADVPFGSETLLSPNSWGFTTNATKYNNNQFAAVPLYSTPAKISEQNSAGTYNPTVYYAVQADTNMHAGSYNGTVVYTIISDSVIDTSGIQSVTPSSGTVGDTITIVVKLNAPMESVSDLGTITTTIGGENCSDPSYTLSDDSANRKTILTITCTVPDSLTGSGQKSVIVSTQRYGQTYEGDFDYRNTFMQYFTIEDCNNLTTSTSSSPATVNLVDKRDRAQYKVSKLADGNCWMVDNLALDGTTDGSTPRTLTPADSDVTLNYTFPSGVDISVGTRPVDTTPQIVTRDKEKTDNNIKYGNYYNFLAATAGWGTTSVYSGNSPQSVCPKGWKLPASGGDKSYYILLTTNYGVTSSNVWTTVRNAPLYFPAAGNYSSSMSNQGSSGYYWSRGVSSAKDTYILYFYNGSYYPQNRSNKDAGFSVRCVFDPPTMQNFTAQDCTNLTLSTSSVDNRKLLRDVRDNTYYNIAKLADGNCWMVDNLALNGTTDGTTPRTLTTSDSDVTSNYTFPSGVDISSGSSSNTTPQIRPTDKDKTDNGNKYGNYYNFLAATAGWGTTSISSGDSPQSICPKGWKLPTYSGDKSFQNLGVQYGLSSSGGSSISTAWSILRNAPLYFPAAGKYDSGVSNQGSVGYYRSRRVSSADSAYYLYLGSDDYYPQNSYGKNYGYSVRCVFGG